MRVGQLSWAERSNLYRRTYCVMVVLMMLRVSRQLRMKIPKMIWNVPIVKKLYQEIKLWLILFSASETQRRVRFAVK